MRSTTTTCVLLTDGELAEWRLIPETAVGFIPIIAVDHVRLQNSGSAAVAVAQDFVVTAGQPFELTFEGFVAAQLSTLESPRVELHWRQRWNVNRRD